MGRGERKHRGVDLLECGMPESWLDWHQTKCLQPPPQRHSHSLSFSFLSLSWASCPQSNSPFSLPTSLYRSLPQPMKQESRHLRFLLQDQRSLCQGLRTDGIPSPCCYCCWPAVVLGIQNRPLTSVWLLEYAVVPRIKRNTEDRHTHPVHTFICT